MITTQFKLRILTATLLFTSFTSFAATHDPEATTGIEQKQLVTARHYMASAANPLAVKAGEQILAKGGSAVDAAIAMQLMLGLVEPQSSGIGGGLFLLHWDKQKASLTSIDGRETAPAAAGPDLFVENGKLMSWREAFVGGKSVGVPGVVKALELAHQQHGVLPWAELFAPAIQMAEKGFVVSPRLAGLLKANWNPGLDKFASSAAYFKTEGQWLPAGFVRKNLAYAALLQKIAKEGSKAFYQGDNAKALVAAVQQAPVNAGQISLADLAGYQPKPRDPLCIPYRQFKICSMAPPSSGGLAVLQMMGMLSHQPLAKLKPNSVEAIHLISQAAKLAFADRERFAADPDFVKVPVQGLLAPDYLKQRAALLTATEGAAALAGEPEGAEPLASGHAIEFANTSHLSVVDAKGNAVSMTTSIENAFGSGIFVNGYLLNNQLTDFSLQAKVDGYWVANRVEAKKRPRSSMAPMMVFDKDGTLLYITGSPGGSRIINYVAQNLVAVLDWGMDAQQAANLPRFSHRNDGLVLEQNTNLSQLVPALLELGYQPKLADLNSGIHAIKITKDRLEGSADPRREGIAAGR
ncbi:gamma-glutamyltransferase [Rheinheimera sp.]|uniref:gamma-glutamyltransferase n=1 Tax=Rheinheimera sp. TaxID=1869214 RepID=UPI002611C2CC|nr:gamma-glutamyltransferase [Rheinheimera sp.]MCA1928785.1 gamma-glutamyltransferase [Rheinheimera sp.]